MQANHDEPAATVAAAAPGVYSSGTRVLFYSEVTRQSVRELRDALQDAETERARVRWLHELDGAVFPIRLDIHSEGGDIFAAFDALDAIRAVPQITTVARGMCASGATLMFLAGERRLVTRNTHLLIHQLSSLFAGTYSQIEDEKHLLDRLMYQIVEFCAERTGQPKDEIQAMLQRDTWLDAPDALRLGFATGVL